VFFKQGKWKHEQQKQQPQNTYRLTSLRDQTLAEAFVLMQFIQETIQFWTSCTNSFPKFKANLKLIIFSDRCEASLTKPHQYPD